MSSGLMKTDPGGENQQYETIHTVTKPHSKDGGQMGEAETEAPTKSVKSDAEKAERGEKTAENIRYGQKISEEGMGGQTTTSSGSANTDAGLGGSADDQEDAGTSADSARKAQGYGGERDMDKNIGG